MNDETIHTVGNDSPARPRGIPLWLLIFGVLLFAGVGIAALATTFIKKTDAPAKVATAIARVTEPLYRDLGATQADPLFATRRNAMMDSAAHTTNAIVDALTALYRVRESAEALLTNDTGRLIAKNKELVDQAARLYAEELPKLASSAELVAKMGAVRQMEMLVTSASDENDVNQTEFNTAVQNATVFAEQSIQQSYPARMLLASLIEEAKYRPDNRTNTQQSLTLGATLGQRMEANRLKEIERAWFESYMRAAHGDSNKR